MPRRSQWRRSGSRRCQGADPGGGQAGPGPGWASRAAGLETGDRQAGCQSVCAAPRGSSAWGRVACRRRGLLAQLSPRGRCAVPSRPFPGLGDVVPGRGRDDSAAEGAERASRTAPREVTPTAGRGDPGDASKGTRRPFWGPHNSRAARGPPCSWRFGQLPGSLPGLLSRDPALRFRAPPLSHPVVQSARRSGRQLHRSPAPFSPHCPITSESWAEAISSGAGVARPASSAPREPIRTESRTEVVAPG